MAKLILGYFKDDSTNKANTDAISCDDLAVLERMHTLQGGQNGLRMDDRPTVFVGTGLECTDANFMSGLWHV